ncbi:hypothetical protein SAMN02745166_01918 [Prosthecobacter debontii]|uniref:Outer membrane protein beta-barrel domain-containing protein n=1 Tax=Prosthecobacter debontii TaxID=48467 RepID=A0A1T4XSV6_9BACT|nr:hypothetical protein [Prosthecobacter debontii]SKA92604.1 hypothetical protein SAMN02745166_01918 [Prosthecobacter debontii]
MKSALAPFLLALVCLATNARAQYPGAPSYPGATGSYGAPPAGAGLYGSPSYGNTGGYTAMSPSLPAPQMGSPYAGPTMMDPSAPPPPGTYNFQQPSTQNSWGGIQQSMAGSNMLHYRYLEAGYRYVDPQGGELDGSHGLGVTLSIDLPTIFFLKGTINWSSGTGKKNVRGATEADYDLAVITVGGGAYMAVTPKLHFVGEIGLVYANLSSSGSNISYSDAGIYVRPSLRYQLVDWLELQAGVTVSSADDYDSKVVDFGAYFRVFPQVDMNLGMDLGDETRTIRAGARMRW